MKQNRIALLLACALFAGISAGAQERPAAFERILSDPEYAYLEYRDYPVPDCKPSAPPKGYKPVYISHYSRHGSRYNYIQSSYDNLKALFEKALAADVLTGDGKALARKYLEAFPYFDLHAGDLTRKGWDQHYGIGKRMYQNYREVFRKRPVIDARASTIPRSIMSMVAFCDALEERDSKLQITKQTSESWLHIMNPHHSTKPFAELAKDGKKAYGKEWEAEMKALQAKIIPAKEYLKKYFTDLDWVKRNFGLTKLKVELYRLMISTECTDVPYHFTELFTPEELCGLWEWSNLLYYNKWGPGHNGLNHSFYIAAYLLEDILDKAEEDLADGRIGARLRFGHDTPIGMLLTLLDMDGWNKGAEHPEDVKYIYDFSNVPMAANLQLIFYRNRKGDTLVKMMLNEKDITPYYRWEDFLAKGRATVASAKQKMEEYL